MSVFNPSQEEGYAAFNEETVLVLSSVQDVPFWTRLQDSRFFSSLFGRREAS